MQVRQDGKSSGNLRGKLTSLWPGSLQQSDSEQPIGYHLPEMVQRFRRASTEEILKGRWWERRSDGYYCREHRKKLNLAPPSLTMQFTSIHGKKLMCSSCGNWMFDLEIREH